MQLSIAGVLDPVQISAGNKRDVARLEIEKLTL